MVAPGRSRGVSGSRTRHREPLHCTRSGCGTAASQPWALGVAAARSRPSRGARDLRPHPWPQHIPRNSNIAERNSFVFKLGVRSDPQQMQPAARQLARAMHGGGANIALLVPVRPLCTPAVCGLAHCLEGEGIATVVIGLIPQHVRAMKPPRALLAPFELGRPLGLPSDLDLQRKVLFNALDAQSTRKRSSCSPCPAIVQDRVSGRFQSRSSSELARSSASTVEKLSFGMCLLLCLSFVRFPVLVDVAEFLLVPLRNTRELVSLQTHRNNLIAST